MDSAIDPLDKVELQRNIALVRSQVDTSKWDEHGQLPGYEHEAGHSVCPGGKASFIAIGLST